VTSDPAIANEHADRAFHDPRTGRNDSVGLLAAQHRLCDLLSVGEVGDPHLHDLDPGDRDRPAAKPRGRAGGAQRARLAHSMHSTLSGAAARRAGAIGSPQPSQTP
jgi:hypothetical protein